MVVYVLNKHGKPLMPCHPAKARILLKQGKAKVIQRTPFTIKLLYRCSGYKQPVTLGVDSGYKYIGLSAITDKRELFSAEVELRSDISRLLQKRKEYRRGRRNRLWYRKPRFLNRGRSEGWLPPSIQHKLDSYIRLVKKVAKILPVSKVVVEVAAFDIQKIKNPSISGVEYQNGEQKGFWNVREYVLYRDGHTCRLCKNKTKNKVLEVHHLIPRNKGGTDKPDNLITLCRTCHKLIHEKGMEYDLLKRFNPPMQFKAETFMTTVRWKIVNKLKELGYEVSHTYGYITKCMRISLGLEKTRYHDAFCIAGGKDQKRLGYFYFIKQVRRQNRSLYKAKLLKGGKRKVNTIKEAFGFRRFDKVSYNGIECFIYALRTKGYFDLRKLDGEKISPSVSYKKLRLLERAKTFLIERKPQLLPAVNDRVSAA
ncbi:RNA-guided endonuclease IscB [Deferribacter abyssi]|uniref:RNA-guided endonuclease IscB n=1 Tax=Deferribacter abyssi TaxID=213806 RepID=UPI003C141253